METCSEKCTGCSVRAVRCSEGHCDGEGRDAAESELGAVVREAGLDKNAEIWQKFFWKISRKSFVYAEYRDCKFVCYMRE